MTWYYSLIIGVCLALLPTFIRNMFGSWFRSENYYLNNYQELAKLYGPQNPFLQVNKSGFERKMIVKLKRIFRWRMATKFILSVFQTGEGLLIPEPKVSNMEIYRSKFLFPIGAYTGEESKKTFGRENRKLYSLVIFWTLLTFVNILLFVAALDNILFFGVKFTKTREEILAGFMVAFTIAALIAFCLQILSFYRGYSFEAIHLFVHHGFLNEESFLRNDFQFLAKTDLNFRKEFGLDNFEAHRCVLNQNQVDSTAKEAELENASVQKIDVNLTKNVYIFLSLGAFVLLVLANIFGALL